MRRYYSSRNGQRAISLRDLFQRSVRLFALFLDKNYFLKYANSTSSFLADEFADAAFVALGFNPFPTQEWPISEVSEERVFDFIEFLYDHVSQPGPFVPHTDESGWSSYRPKTFDDAEGKQEFRSFANQILCDYRDGYELNLDGDIASIAPDGLYDLVNAKIEPIDYDNIDKRVLLAISKWSNRDLNAASRREAVRDLADVFEWLKKDGRLGKVLEKQDEKDLFHIANQFAIRHHDPKQKSDYDLAIWHSWMFYFYLATYHAVSRMIAKSASDK